MDIPLSMLLLLCLVFTIIGMVVSLLLQYYVYMKFSILPEESAEQRDINSKYSLPETIQQTARAINTSSTAAPQSTNAVETAPLMSINFVMQFLFHELKNASRVRKWFYRKLSLELDELIAKTTTGKLFDKLTIKELVLGDQFPEIKMLRVHSVELDDTGDRIENLDLLLEIHYAGNFRTSIDADMVLGKKGSLTLMVKQLSGLARLQFTRKPYTHWSLSFLGDPELDLAIESKYQGRQMQSNITSLISNQIRKAVRRKHTLPNYKLRYKPFFHKTPEEDAGDGDIQPNGTLEVKVSEISRLTCPNQIEHIYCTLTMASIAFVEVHQRDHRNVVVSMDVEIHKAKNQQIGILFKQAPEQNVEIEAVLPNTPAFKSNLKAGDMLIAIEGKRAQSIQNVAKIFKSLQSSIFRLRIERIIPGIIRNDAILEDLELYEDLGDVHTGYAALKPIDSEVSIKQLTLRYGSIEKSTSSESSLGNTPTSSPKKSKLITKALKKTISRESSESTKDEDAKSKIKSAPKIEERSKSPMRVTTAAGEGVNDVEHYYQHSTIDCALSRMIHMDDTCCFKLDAHCRFLNVCVYAKSSGESQLLGFINIPVSQILAECCETSLIQSWKKFDINPPIPQDLKSHALFNQSGFNADLCFGDILFAFTWDGNPNISANDTPSKQSQKARAKSSAALDKNDDSGTSDYGSTRSISSTSSTVYASTTTASPLRAHNFVRTHFQRATQCDFCGKKIWLKDAVQCRDCSMCCHKKCITKCQNATVCGPVDCTTALQQTAPSGTSTTSANSTNSTTPEFTVTEADACEASEGEEAMPTVGEEEQAQVKAPTAVAGLEVHRSSLTGLLAQGIKRVNSANNLAIPGIVSSLAGGSAAGGGTNVSAKSLPPSPQRSPSRKSSLIPSSTNAFELVTQRLESLPVESATLNSEQISSLTEPIICISKDEDVMTLAKNASKDLYTSYSGIERVNKINLLLSKLRLALDAETEVYSSLATTTKNDTVDGVPSNMSVTLSKSEERVQALSGIMLYLCTGLQHAKGAEFR